MLVRPNMMRSGQCSFQVVFVTLSEHAKGSSKPFVINLQKKREQEIERKRERERKKIKIKRKQSPQLKSKGIDEIQMKHFTKTKTKRHMNTLDVYVLSMHSCAK